MQRFLKDLLRLKAEIICEQFSPDTLASFVIYENEQNPQLVQQAVNLLKTQKLRDMSIDLETDCSFDREKQEENILNVLAHINEMVNQSFALISQQPALLPLYRQMIEAAVATLGNARQFENVLEDVFNKISVELNAPDAPHKPTEDKMLDFQNEKMEKDFAIKKEQNQIKREELDLKKLTELKKLSSK